MRRALDAALMLGAQASHGVPMLQPHRWGIRRLANISYGRHPEQILDVYLPKENQAKSVIVYFHGGGFRLFSPESYLGLATLLAQSGSVVVMAGYRLAPRHPYPAALMDAAHAVLWSMDAAEAYGFCSTRWSVGGDSAGANLALAMVLAAKGIDWPWPSSKAKPVQNPLQKAKVPLPQQFLGICGLYSLGDPDEMFLPSTPRWMMRRLRAIEKGYLGDFAEDALKAQWASPRLGILRDASAPNWPRFLLASGKRDLLAWQSEALAKDLGHMHGVDSELLRVDGGHLFFTAMHKKATRSFWLHAQEFLSEIKTPE